MNNLTHREEINLYETIQKSFPKILIKDLTEHERICPVCNVGENDIALICYEKPTDFCHRHLVADWLNKNGFKCDEYLFNK